MDDPLIWVRAVHFAATILVTGVVFFSVFISEPAFRKAGGDERVATAVRTWLARFVWIGSLATVVSGAAWLLFVAARMVDLPLVETFSGPAVLTVLTRTDFGRDWMVRLVLTVLLSGVLFPSIFNRLVKSRGTIFVVVLFAAGLVGTLAWAGHGAAGTGFNGSVHLTADILHLVAAAAWVGSLVPLAVLLGAAARSRDEFSARMAREAVLRFSTLGVVSVGMLLASGIINTLMLAGSVAALVGTDYGRLLLLKIALFVVMLTIAGVNRIVLTPRLVRAQSSSQYLLRQLRNNSLIEAAIGAIILVIVGVLGTLPPGIQELAAR